MFIRDLGFNSLWFLATIAGWDAYFLGRYKIHTVIHYKEKRRSISQMISKMTPAQNLAEFEVELGADKKIRRTLGKVRLVLQKLPPRAVKQKMKKLYEDARRKARTPSKEQKLLCHYNVYITNAQADKLPLESIRILYTVRWQIELAFKIWKSIFAIDKVKAVKIERFQCFFYGALISIVLTIPIVMLYKVYFWNQRQKEISEWKVYRMIFEEIPDLIKALCQPGQRLQTFLEQLFEEIEYRGGKDKKKIVENNRKITKPLPIDIFQRIS